LLLSSALPSAPGAGDASLRAKTHWVLLGVEICVDAFVKLLGIGKHRLYKLLHGIMDGRHLRKGLSSSEAPKSRLVHLLLSHIYSHDAEPLLRTDDNEQVPGPRCDDPFDPAAEHSPHTFNDDPDTAYSKAIALLDGWRPGEEASILMTKVDQLPIRHLPPGSVSDLHLQILSLCQVREIPKEEWPSYWTSRAVYFEICDAVFETARYMQNMGQSWFSIQHRTRQVRPGVWATSRS